MASVTVSMSDKQKGTNTHLTLKKQGRELEGCLNGNEKIWASKCSNQQLQFLKAEDDVDIGKGRRRIEYIFGLGNLG